MKLTSSLLFKVIIIIALASGGATLDAQEAADTSRDLARCWQYSDPETYFLKLAADSTGVFIAEENARVVSLDPATGANLWKSEFGGEIVSNIALAPGRLSVVTRSVAAGGAPAAATLRVLSRETGVTLWRRDLAGSGDFFVIDAGETILAAAASGDVAGYASGDGALRWKLAFAGGLTADARLSGDTAVFATGGKRVVAIKAISGETETAFDVQRTISAVSPVLGTDVWLGDTRGEISKRRLGGERSIWSYRVGAGISRIDRVDDDILVASLDNFLYRIGGDSGHVAWKRRMSGRITSVVSLTDERAAVFTQDSEIVQVIDLSNGRTVSQFSLIQSAIAAAATNNGVLSLLSNDVVIHRSGECKK